MKLMSLNRKFTFLLRCRCRWISSKSPTSSTGLGSTRQHRNRYRPTIPTSGMKSAAPEWLILVNYFFLGSFLLNSIDLFLPAAVVRVRVRSQRFRADGGQWPRSAAVPTVHIIPFVRIVNFAATNDAVLLLFHLPNIGFHSAYIINSWWLASLLATKSTRVQIPLPT